MTFEWPTMSEGHIPVNSALTSEFEERMLNPDQLSWLRHIRSIPREQRCADGWHMKGDCPNEREPLT